MHFFPPKMVADFPKYFLALTGKITRRLKSPFWNAKVQIHSLHAKTKTEVNQLAQVHEAIWPLAQEDTVETSGDLFPQDQVIEFQTRMELMDQTVHFYLTLPTFQ